MRYPAVAGRFYPAEPEALSREIEHCFTHDLGPGIPGDPSGDRRISAAVCPHAGYRASGMNAAHVYRSIAEDGLPEAYVIIGPDHYGVPFDTVMCGDEYLTPFGPCKVHTGIAEKLRQYIPDSLNAHRLEHSIEVQIPFIQYIDPDPHIVPIIMGDQTRRNADMLAGILRQACSDCDCVIIASSDLSHYIPKTKAKELDSLFLEKVAAKDVDGLYSAVVENRMSVCGYGPVAVAIMAAEPSEVKILSHTDSWDSIGYDENSVVGYGSAIMYGKK